MFLAPRVADTSTVATEKNGRAVSTAVIIQYWPGEEKRGASQGRPASQPPSTATPNTVTQMTAMDSRMLTRRLAAGTGTPT